MAGRFTPDDLLPLFAPRSIAVIGASGRKDRPGYDTLGAATCLGWNGELYPVTPGYEEIDGRPCFPHISEIDQHVDLAIIAGSPQRMATDLDDALDADAASVIIYGNPNIVDDKLKARIQERAAEAGIPLLGPNSIGYVNYSQGTAGSWVLPGIHPCGHIAGIIQSGSYFGSCTLVDPRIRYCLTIHPGQETSVTMGEMMGYALTLPETRVLALYLEIVYDADSLVAGLAAANRAGIPVVVLKPGRSASSQSAIATHTGRLAAPDEIIDAVLQRHNAIRVSSTDEWLTTLALLSGLPGIGPGGLSLAGDSGGMKAVIIDEAERLRVPLTELGQSAVNKLTDILAPDLKPENPVDYWGGEKDIRGHVRRCMEIIGDDDNTAVAVGMGEFGCLESDAFTNRVAEGVTDAALHSRVPVVACNYSSRQFFTGRILDMYDKGIPVLDGITPMLQAFGHSFNFRDRVVDPVVPDQAMTSSQLQNINKALDSLSANDESGSLDILSRAGITTVQGWVADNGDGVEEIARQVTASGQWPVVMKTAQGHGHKAELGGVVTDIHDTASLVDHYFRMQSAIGPAVLIQPMIRGTELALGVVNDGEYGPMLMISSGGLLVEKARDRSFLPCPIYRHECDAALDRLDCAALFQGYRGQPPLDRAGVEQAIYGLASLTLAARDRIRSIDINPLIVHPTGCVAVDALIEPITD